MIPARRETTTPKRLKIDPRRGVILSTAEGPRPENIPALPHTKTAHRHTKKSKKPMKKSKKIEKNKKKPTKSIKKYEKSAH
jgi:hypothetical protein